MARDDGCLSIGVDIGATKLAILVADRQGESLHRGVSESAGGETVEAFFDRLANDISDLRARFDGIRGIGIGVPGPVDSERGIAINAVNLGWRGVQVREKLEARLARRIPILVDNDVNVGAMGEKHFGAARGHDNFVYLAIGTGLGGAVFCDGRLLRGASHSEMEIGHVSLDPVNGRLCDCGLRGCLEMSISGKGLIAIADQRLHDNPTSALDRIDLTTAAIVEAAEAGDGLARRVMDEAGEALGIACAWCLAVFNPALVVLGGGFSHAVWHLLEAPAWQTLETRCLRDNVEAARICLSRHRDAALGAAAMVWQRQEEGKPK